MLSSLTRFTVALALASSILGAVIPITTPTTSSTATATVAETVQLSETKGLTGALFKNSVHEKIYLSEASAATPTTEGNISNMSSCKLLLTRILSCTKVDYPLLDGPGNFGGEGNMMR
jgi:hypothetical protein